MPRKAEAGADRVTVEVVFALPETQWLQSLTLDSGATVADAIARSGLAQQQTGIDLASLAVGIWGRVVDRSRLLVDGDRVELYRPLRLDPRQARRQLAAAGLTMSGQDAKSN